jgi:hypothetical protein
MPRKVRSTQEHEGTTRECVHEHGHSRAAVCVCASCRLRPADAFAGSRLHRLRSSHSRDHRRRPCTMSLVSQPSCSCSCSSSTTPTAAAAVRHSRRRSWSRAERAAFLHRRAAQARTHATGDRTTSRCVTADGAPLDCAVRGAQGCRRRCS